MRRPPRRAMARPRITQTQRSSSTGRRVHSVETELARRVERAGDPKRAGLLELETSHVVRQSDLGVAARERRCSSSSAVQSTATPISRGRRGRLPRDGSVRRSRARPHVPGVHAAALSPACARLRRRPLSRRRVDELRAAGGDRTASAGSSAVNVVVTGATGFIGSRVWPLLVAHGHAVTATARAGGYPAEPRVRWTICDVRDPGFADVLPRTADAVVHLAQAEGWPPGDSLLGAVNVESTRLLLDYSRRAGVKRFILASSGSVYGGAPAPLREDQPARPLDAYARSKAEAEALLRPPPSIGVCALHHRILLQERPAQRSHGIGGAHHGVRLGDAAGNRRHHGAGNSRQ